MILAIDEHQKDVAVNYYWRSIGVEKSQSLGVLCQVFFCLIFVLLIRQHCRLMLENLGFGFMLCAMVFTAAAFSLEWFVELKLLGKVQNRAWRKHIVPFINLSALNFCFLYAILCSGFVLIFIFVLFPLIGTILLLCGILLMIQISITKLLHILGVFFIRLPERHFKFAYPVLAGISLIITFGVAYLVLPRFAA